MRRIAIWNRNWVITPIAIALYLLNISFLIWGQCFIVDLLGMFVHSNILQEWLKYAKIISLTSSFPALILTAESLQGPKASWDPDLNLCVESYTDRNRVTVLVSFCSDVASLALALVGLWLRRSPGTFWKLVYHQVNIISSFEKTSRPLSEPTFVL